MDPETTETDQETTEPPAGDEPATMASEIERLEAEAAELPAPAEGDPNVIEVAPAEDPEPVQSITRADLSGAGRPRRRGSGSKEHPARRR